MLNFQKLGLVNSCNTAQVNTAANICVPYMFVLIQVNNATWGHDPQFNK